MRKIFFLFFLSGVSSLIYEILWVRMLSLVFGTTTFAITTVVSSFMAGLALGSFYGGKKIQEKQYNFSSLLKIYAYLEIAIGVYAIFSPYLFKLVQIIYIKVYPIYSVSFYSYSLWRFCICFIILLFPTILMGATLPILSKVIAREIETLGEKIGKLYSYNTFGGVAGCFICGFFLLPYFGINITLYLAVLINFVIAGVIFGLKEKHKQRSNQNDRIEVFSDEILMLTRSKQRMMKISNKCHSHESGNPETKDWIPACAGMTAGETFSDETYMPTKSAQRGMKIPPSPLYKRGIKGDLKKGFSDENENFSPSLYILLFAFFLSGFISLLYQIVWTRALILIVGTTVYAFSLILIVFLSGIGFGSYITSKFVDKIKSYIFIFGITQLLIGIYILFSTLIFNKLPYLFFWLSKIFGYDFFPLTLLQFLIIFLILFIPTTLFGCLFPIMIKIYNKDINNVADRTGKIYSINTIGCIFGSFVCGFILIPTIGMQSSIIFGCIINILLCSVIFIDKNISRKVKFASVFIIIFIFAVGRFVPSWNKQIITSEIFLELDNFDRQKRGEVLFYREGAHATVAITRRTNIISLFINGKTDASLNKRDMFTQKLSSHIPMLLHPQPQKILIIGMGSGITAGTSLLYDIPQIHIVEIEKEVVNAAKFFKNYNYNVTTHPKVKIIIDDARNYLLATENKYDIIISEPANLWISGINNLFTKEFLEIAKSKLNKDGIFCQWLHTYKIKSDDLKIATKTFSDAFKNTSMWSMVFGDIILIGTDNKYFDYRDILKKKLFHPKISFDLYYMKAIDIYTLLESSFLLDTDEVHKFAENSIINTDNFPMLEFSVPKSIYKYTTEENLQEIVKYKRSSIYNIVPNAPKDRINKADSYFYLGIAHFAKENYILAINNFEKAITLNNKHSDAYYWLGHSFAYIQDYNNAVIAFKKSIGLNPSSARAYYCLGMIYNTLKKKTLSKKYIDKAMEIEPALSNPKRMNFVLNYVEGF